MFLHASPTLPLAQPIYRHKSTSQEGSSSWLAHLWPPDVAGLQLPAALAASMPNGQGILGIAVLQCLESPDKVPIPALSWNQTTGPPA